MLEFVSIAIVSNKDLNNEKNRCQKHITDDLTRPGQRPGELGAAESSGGVLGSWGRLDGEIGRFGMDGLTDLGELGRLGDVQKT